MLRYLRTIRYLKGLQVYYRLYYGLRNKWRQVRGYVPPEQSYKEPVSLEISFPDLSTAPYQGDHMFEFLNRQKVFGPQINWNYMGYGKLWNYNLLYFDFLNQKEIEADEKLAIIHDFMNRFDDIKFARDPYPISLRCINWIKFLLNCEIEDQKVEQAIYRQYYLLMDQLEYHLMGNHLLENGCSLLFGGVYYNDSTLLDKAEKILFVQLEEQILGDGAHFERSPMYHQLLLHRLLDCFRMLNAGKSTKESLQKLIKKTVQKMLGWISEVTFTNGEIPYVNDSAHDIAPKTFQLIDYAARTGLSAAEIELGESGYRMVKGNNVEWFIDVGNIGPDYIPGHAHSDTFSFVLHSRGEPIIVDTGTSTYEESARRIEERSTPAHNTVMIKGKNQSEVWKSFRVGRRAYITHLQESGHRITAEHDGYKHFGITHRRIFKWDSGELHIEDKILGNDTVESTAYIHFHPRVHIKVKEGRVLAGDTTLAFSGHRNLQEKNYQYAMGFNKLEPAVMLVIDFQKRLLTRIIL